MLSEVIVNHLRAVEAVQKNPWQLSGLSDISARTAPDCFFGEHAVIVRGDVGITWARWFLEGICDPERHVKNHPCFPDIYRIVFRRVQEMFAAMQPQECMAVAKQAANMIHDEVGRRATRKRVSPTKTQKQSLWAAAKPDPRCYICGYKFTKAAEDLFLGAATTLPPLPTFIDFVKLRGLNERHLRVEVDHVQSVALGGKGLGNFELACGWCNVHKSSKTSVYDDAEDSVTVLHPKIGVISIPRPFWIVRILAVRGKCEWPGGCNKTVKNAELTVAPRRLGAAMNPTNLRVICEAHDELRPHRKVTFADAAKMKK